MKKIVGCLLAVMLVSGCATGRVALVDWDMRDKDQITAYYPESEVPYKVQKQDTEEKVGIVTPTPWEFIFDFLKIAKMRIRVLSLEWKN